MADLTTTYMGLTLANPLVPSASTLSRSLDDLRRMEDAGAGAVVLHSLSEGHIDCVRRAKAAVGIPIIGSLNGVSRGGSVRYAREIEQAGADALELNVSHIPTDPGVSSAEIEQEYVDLLLAVRRQVRIPVAVKLSPFFTNLALLAHRLDYAGAHALVLFNRCSQPDIDLETLEVVPRASLSEPDALRLPLRWIALLSGRVAADLAATGGIRSAADVLKALLVGASVTMLTPELLVNGIDRLTAIRRDLLAWLDEHENASVARLRGSVSQRAVAFPSAFEQGHTLRLVSTPTPEIAGDEIGGSWRLAAGRRWPVD